MRSVRAVHECQQHPVAGAQPLGVHLEGPFLDVGMKGAQPPQFIRPATAEEYRDFFALGNIRLISLAPEIDANKELITFARSRGAAVAVGHSSATYEQVLEAVSLGLNQSTHTFNQMAGLHHRKPGTAGAALLIPHIYAQFIADGIHLHPAIVDMIVRLKGADKAVAITDAICGAGMPDGDYELGGQAIVVKDGAVRLADGHPRRKLPHPGRRRAQHHRVRRHLRLRRHPHGHPHPRPFGRDGAPQGQPRTRQRRRHRVAERGPGSSRRRSSWARSCTGRNRKRHHPQIAQIAQILRLRPIRTLRNLRHLSAGR